MIVNEHNRHLNLRERCADCQVAIGERHVGGCDVSRCTVSGIQRIQCGGADDPNEIDPATGELMYSVVHPGRCVDSVWTGLFPMTAEAVLHDWYAYFDDTGWHRCTGDDLRARPDLNRVATELTWDPDRQTWTEQ